jgi:hypothetical protein
MAIRVRAFDLPISEKSAYYVLAKTSLATSAKLVSPVVRDELVLSVSSVKTVNAESKERTNWIGPFLRR